MSEVHGVCEADRNLHEIKFILNYGIDLINSYHLNRIEKRGQDFNDYIAEWEPLLVSRLGSLIQSANFYIKELNKLQNERAAEEKARMGNVARGPWL